MNIGWLKLCKKKKKKYDNRNQDGAHAPAAAFLIRLMMIFMDADAHQYGEKLTAAPSAEGCKSGAAPLDFFHSFPPLEESDPE